MRAPVETPATLVRRALEAEAAAGAITQLVAAWRCTALG